MGPRAAALQRRAAKLPGPVKAALRRVAQVAPRGLRARISGIGRERVRWGNLRRSEPFDRRWGLGRGTPVDRIYIEDFVAQHAGDIRGACLELLNRDYTQRYGGDAVGLSDILDIDPDNAEATVVADLGIPDSLPDSRYDCFIFTQTLHLIPDMSVALANAWRALKQGGVLLVTVPTLGIHIATPGLEHDRWRITPAGLRWLLSRLPNAEYEVVSFGSVLACAALLYGISAEEITPSELAEHDPEYPLIVAARVLKRAQE